MTTPDDHIADAPDPIDTEGPRQRVAAALRRLSHAVVAHEADPEVLEQVAARADRIAAEVEDGTPRSRPVSDIKRRLFEKPSPSGTPLNHFDDCIVSGPTNPMGIGVQVRRDGDEAVGEVTLGQAFEGAPKRAHGGITAAIFDDVMGYVLVLLRLPAYTGRLEVQYRAPVPLGRRLEVRGRLVERDERKLKMAAIMTLADDPERPVVAEAEGLFIAIPPERLGIDPDELARYTAAGEDGHVDQ